MHGNISVLVLACTASLSTPGGAHIYLPPSPSCKDDPGRGTKPEWVIDCLGYQTDEQNHFRRTAKCSQGRDAHHFPMGKNTVVNGMHLLGLGPKATHCPPLLAFLEQLWANLTRGPVPKSTLLVAPTSIEIGSSKEHSPPTPVSASASCEDEDDGPSDRNQPKAAYVSDHPASAYHVLSPSANNLVAYGENELVSIKRAFRDLVSRCYGGTVPSSAAPIPYTVQITDKKVRELYRNHFYRNICNLYAAMMLQNPAAQESLRNTATYP